MVYVPMAFTAHGTVIVPTVEPSEVHDLPAVVTLVLQRLVVSA
jgi:hypothetical protein